MSDIVLYDYWRSSASYRVRIALNLAGIAYDAVAVDLLKREHKSADHLARNPQGLVPALLIDSHLFTQSLAIIEYLDETRSLKLLPSAPAARAEVRTLAYAVAMDIHPVCNLSIVAHVMKLTAGDDAVRQAWMQKFIGEGLAAVEQLLQKTPGPLSFGDSPTLADLCLLPQVYNARRWSADIGGLARVNAVAAALETIPAFAAAHPDNHKPTS
jgi:maleylacetoacetate isomerase